MTDFTVNSKLLFNLKGVTADITDEGTELTLTKEEAKQLFEAIGKELGLPTEKVITIKEPAVVPSNWPVREPYKLERPDDYPQPPFTTICASEGIKMPDAKFSDPAKVRCPVS